MLSHPPKQDYAFFTAKSIGHIDSAVYCGNPQVDPHQTAYSGPWRSGILADADHRFWSMPIKNSGASRSVILAMPIVGWQRVNNSTTTLDSQTIIGHPSCQQGKRQGGSNDPSEVIHAQNRRSFTIERNDCALSGPIV